MRFDAQSAWLIGTDFGVLKIDSGQTGNNANALRVTNDGNSLAESSGYVLTLQAVFNDPHLYGLRIALDGAAAKVFKGLDFQIMYRQVSDTVGVYQAEITLPDLMRHLTVGAYSLTLPVFGIAVYTNGDFQVDIGFPWNENFSRSFTIEAIIPPGIPVLGSAGFYFGKLSSASTNRVPASSYGTFNPVLVFGFGMQVGFGKSIEYGILSAGFSVTVVGILEGILAKWNPYQLTHSGREPSTQLQGDYYFWLRGTVGIVGRVYGSVDFAIVKANVDITVKLLLQLTYESYVSITITVIASVDVSVSVKINLGLFKISISFSFSMRLKETFTIDNRGAAPWLGDGRNVRGVLRLPVERRLSGFARASARQPAGERAELGQPAAGRRDGPVGLPRAGAHRGARRMDTAGRTGEPVVVLGRAAADRIRAAGWAGCRREQAQGGGKRARQLVRGARENGAALGHRGRSGADDAGRGRSMPGSRDATGLARGRRARQHRRRSDADPA